jgi:hypothetical protein
MCKFNPRNQGRRLDPCMKEYIEMVNKILKRVYETKACCCGHGKYPKTIVVGLKGKNSYCFDLISGMMIKRTKRFYKKDKQGYYFIPEVSNG